MSEPLTAVAGMGFYAPGFPNLDAFIGGEPDPEAPDPTGALLDRRTKRRASPLSRALADAYGEALAQAGFDPATVGSVFGSALGEASTMISLLDQMWREGGALSPMRFATSVHNAAAGVVSISTVNRGFTTSLGADHDTPAMALVEALGVMATQNTPVMVACGDEAAPADLVLDGGGWSFVTAALALEKASDDNTALPRLRGPFIGDATLAPSDLPQLPQLPQLPPALALNPQAGLVDLIVALRSGASGIVRLDRGRGRGFCVEILRG
jgi:hypothetical protein